jgi:sugar phosphate isomerase/epimerase
MFKNLSPGAIGIRNLSLADAIRLARDTGFAGIDFSIREAAALAEAHGVDYVRELFERTGVRPGQWGLPVAWTDDSQWEADLANLPPLAALGRALGCTRTATWCLSFSDVRPYAENFAWHVARFRPIAQVLADHGCRLGIEFLGPKTLRDGHPYPFIHTLAGMMELASEIGTGNVGLLLDAWHLYTSGGSVDDLDRITAEDIVTVHVNDAPRGVERDQLVDNVRGLPLETGVIDLPAFMRKLAALGYDGPITPEPFSAPLNEIAAQDPLRAARLTSEALDRLWAASGLA